MGGTGGLEPTGAAGLPQGSAAATGPRYCDDTVLQANAGSYSNVNSHKWLLPGPAQLQTPKAT